MNSGTCTWDLTDPQIVRRILSAKNGTPFTCQPFKIANLKWILIFFPNGHDKQHRGLTAVNLKLISMPNTWKSIYIQYTIKCDELDVETTDSNLFSVNHIHGAILSSFKRLKIINPNQFTFNVTITITRIKSKQNDNILYQIDSDNYKQQTQIEWSINNMISNIKTLVREESIESNNYNDIWNIKLYPFGIAPFSNNNVALCLRLCFLPKNITKLTVKWGIYYFEGDIKQTIIKEMDEENNMISWDLDTISVNKIRGFDTFTISSDIMVLTECDIYNNDNVSVLKLEEIENKENKMDIYDENNFNLREGLEMNQASIQSLSMENQQLRQQIIGLNAKIDKLTQTVSTLKMQTMQLLKDKEENIERKDNDDMDTRKEILLLKQQINKLSNGKLNMDKEINPNHKKVKFWLKRELNLEQYFDTFIENGFDDPESLKSLTMNVLVNIGIEKIGHRMKILRCVRKLNNWEDIDDDDDDDDDDDNDIIHSVNQTLFTPPTAFNDK